MTIVPGETACLRCLMPECPPPGSSPTCDTAGILGPIVSLIAAIQAAEAIKLLAGLRQAISRSLVVVDLWENRLRQIDMTALAQQGNCSTCRGREFPWLEGRFGSRTAVLCGRNSVQLAFPNQSPMPLSALAGKLSGLGQLTQNQYLLRLKTPSHELTLFADGRAIVSGTDDIATARALYARYVGN